MKGGLYYALKQVTGNEGVKKGSEKTHEVRAQVFFTPQEHPDRAAFSQIKS